MLGLFKRKTSISADTALPAHVAFIMDGNRRWAKRRGMPPMEGHRRGADVLEPLVRHLISRGVSTVSLYTFSIENWSRPKEEIDFLMKYIQSEMPRLITLAKKESVRVKFIGRRDRLAAKTVKMFAKAEEETSENTRGTIVFAIDYSGQDEIVRAANEAIASGAPVDTESFETFMDTGDLLPIDLVVRTSGEQRISNFMLWKLAYAEMLFIPEDWPDVNEKILDRILGDFSKRQRRFGK
jgi:undecaprenyl diphosphate synthase